MMHIIDLINDYIHVSNGMPGTKWCIIVSAGTCTCSRKSRVDMGNERFNHTNFNYINHRYVSLYN